MLAAEARTEAVRRRPAWMAMIFLAVFMLLHLSWDSAAGSGFERLIINDLIVRPAAWVIQQFWPDQQVVARGHQLLSPNARLNILVGCDGLETLFLLWAAFLAYPFAWRVRLIGFALGAVFIYVINQGRIVALWHAWLIDRDLFAALHGVVLPLVMVACCLVFFLLFLVRHGAPETR
jgi:exosortase/archaeosortase family protein